MISPSGARRTGPDRILGRLVLAVLLAATLFACVVDTEIPPDALLTCFEDAHCPAGWSCDPASGLCLAPGGISPVDPEVAQARLAFCDVLWESAQPCSEELEEAMGDAALVFTLPRPTFLHLCTTNLLSETTIDDIGELEAGASFIPLLSCEGLADLLCEQFSEEGEGLCN